MSLSRRSSRRRIARLAVVLALVAPAAAAKPGFHFEAPLLLPLSGRLAADGVDSRFGQERFVVGDVDGDGRQDLVVAFNYDDVSNDYIPPHIDILRRRADGGFEFPIRYDVPGMSADDRVKLVDLDGDAAMEILVSGQNADGATAFLVVDVAPDGSVSTQELAHWADYWPSAIDVDFDGREDLFSVYNVDQASPPNFTWGLWWHRPSVGRGVTKLALVRAQGGVFHLPGYTNGGITATNPTPYRLDLDGDGFEDAYEGGVLWHWQPWSKLVAEPVTAMQYRLGDLDGDGRPDGVRLLDRENPFPPDFSVALQTAPNHFEDIGKVDDPDFKWTSQPQIADIDNNGLNDIVFLRNSWSIDGSDEAGYIAYLLQTAPGTFEYTEQLVANAGGLHKAFAIADLDHDGCQDLLVQSAGNLLDYRGHRCRPAADLRVTSAWNAGTLAVAVDNLSSVPSVAQLLRVNIALRAPSEAGYGIAITAPAGCSVAADSTPPRHVYNCPLPALAAGGGRRLPFAVRSTTGVALPLVSVAFLPSLLADIQPANNRSALAITLPSRTTLRRAKP